MAFVSEDRKYVQIICGGQPKVYQQTRLRNKYRLTHDSVNALFTDNVEVEVHKDRCKVFDLIPPIQVGSSTSSTEVDQLRQPLTTWLVETAIVLQMLESNQCSAIVDGSFFPAHPEFISAHWKFIYNKKIVGQGGFVAKVQSHLQSAYAAEVCGGLGVLSSIQQVMDCSGQRKKIDFALGTDCQSAIHKFLFIQKVVPFDSKLSYEVRELQHIKSTYIRKLSTFKIAGHQDDVKKAYDLSFEERINILCDAEAKQLIREQIESNGSPTFPFQLKSPTVVNNFHETLCSTGRIKEEIYEQLAAPYLVKKLRITSLEEVDCKFRKQVTNMLSDSMHIWWSKSFANFTGTAHQLCRQELLSTSTCRMCNTVQEMDTLHVLFCPNRIFQLYKNEVVSTL